jgi:oligoribonuclease NrnB/cAMP/cGMP phosphodiesterase (DHH superfamily)
MDPISICFYHTPCQDGYAGAHVVQLYYNNVELIGISPSSRIDELVYKEDKYKSNTICFVDVCPPEDNVKNLSKLFKSIYIFDHHHSTSKYNFNNFNNIYFEHDFTKSGCQIVFDYLNSVNSVNSTIQRPWYLDYIGDRDLWNHKLLDTKSINSGLFSQSVILGGYEFFKQLDSQIYTKERVKEIGEKNLIEEGKEIQQSVLNAQEYCFHYQQTKYRCWKYDCKPSLRSDIGNELMKKQFKDGNYPDFTVFWKLSPSGKEWYVSLRGNGKINLSDLANLYFSGGGHISAAGFTIRMKDMGPNDPIHSPDDIFFPL